MHGSLEYALHAQKAFFTGGATRCIHFRITQLRQLKQLLISHEKIMLDALQHDLGKPTFEAYTNELYPVLQEIDLAITNMPAWTQQQRVKSPWMLQPATSCQYAQPYGHVLIISPWNYPLRLTLLPLIGAIAAGNCALVKPSEYAPHTSQALATLINNHFDPGFIHVIQGDKDTADALLKYRFDYLFFTGSTAVGTIVMQVASKYLTPVTLELGGKSPTIVHKDASLDCAAKRIVWGKFLNAGQSCVAPDYLLVHTSAKKELIQRMQYWIHHFYGPDAATSNAYGRIVNEHHFDRLSGLLRQAPVLAGGNTDRNKLYIEPTLLEQHTFAGPLMEEEILGPLLPILTYEHIESVLQQINAMPKTLALYLFTHDEQLINRIRQTTSSGTLSINEVVLHTASPYLPFGGVGSSGFGAYHGKASFDTFSHYKSILRKNCRFDNPLRYPPYTWMHQGLLRYLRWLCR
jgi:aldehyde dehydrogenase (NAD+)